VIIACESRTEIASNTKWTNGHGGKYIWQSGGIYELIVPLAVKEDGIMHLTEHNLKPGKLRLASNRQ
jgi:hypothetical protein